VCPVCAEFVSVLAAAAGQREHDERERGERQETHEESHARSYAVRRTADSQVSVYSGPEPPSGGVSRPPFAVIAPHWTQFDGVTCTVTSPADPPSASS
jgi:hypothetical protein